MNKAIGILGGMGPQASIHMLKTITDISFRKFGAKSNSDFPEVVMDLVPVPDFIASDSNRGIALQMLKKRTAKFDDSFVCLSIACNSAHVLLDELKKATSIPFISMVDEVSNSVKRAGYKKAGIIATPSTLKYELYQKSLTQLGVSSILPDKTEINSIEKIIRNVIRGMVLKCDTRILREIADSMKLKGADCVILGCTEIPLVFPKKHQLPIFDSIEILSYALLQKYYRNKRAIKIY